LVGDEGVGIDNNSVTSANIFNCEHVGFVTDFEDNVVLVCCVVGSRDSCLNIVEGVAEESVLAVVFNSER